LSTIDNTPKHNTRNEIAKTLNWSTGKVAMADIVKQISAEQKPIETRKEQQRKQQTFTNKLLVISHKNRFTNGCTFL
jgi:hypothetical protein